jgi:hypothetical protein
MKRIIRLTEKDLTRLVKKILKEGDPGDGKRDDFSEYEGRTDIYGDSVDDESITQPVAEYWKRRRRLKEEMSFSGDDIEKAKTCFAKAKLVPPAKGHTAQPFNFPKICEKGFSDACVREMFSQFTIFSGTRQKDWSLMNCLLKIKTLQPKLQVYSDGAA